MSNPGVAGDGNGTNHRPKVLIANDQEWSGRSLETIFSAEGYGVVRAFTGAQALKQADASEPDVIILDRQLPDLDGAEVCRRLRGDPRIGPTTPIIITTAGQAGRAQREEAFAAGAWDFFGQPIDGEILLHKVRTFVQAKQAGSGGGDRLLDRSTGLYTAEGLDRRAREIVAEARRNGQSVACVVFAPGERDLEGALERVEELAHRVAAFFRESGRASDAVGRLGPLEFGVVAPGTSAEGAARMIERIEGAVSNGNGNISVRAGYFIPESPAEIPSDPGELLAKAGAALRVAVKPFLPAGS